MGKHKYKRQRSRGDPLKRPDGRDQRDVADKVSPILQGLKSTKLADRAVALSACASLLDDARLRTLLLQNGLVETVFGHTLSDNSLELVAEGFGVLRNLVSVEPELALVFVKEKQLLIAVEASAKKATDAIGSAKDLNKVDRSILVMQCENLCGLGTALLLSGDSDVDAAVEQCSGLVELAHTVLNHDLGAVSSVVALEFLYYLSHTVQVPAVNSVVQNAATQIYETGIKLNQGRAEKMVSVLPVLSQILDEEAASQTPELQTMMSDAAQVGLDIVGELAPREVEKGTTKNLLKALQVLAKVVERPHLRTTAITSLNNIAWALNAIEQPWQNDAEPLIKIVSFSLAAAESSEEAEPAIGLVGALAAQLPTHPTLQKAIEAPLQRALEGLEVSDAYLCALATAIGYLGTSPALLEPSGRFIVGLLASSTSDVVMAGLDALFELFGSDDENAAALYDANNLQQLLNSLVVRLDKILDSRDARQAEALENLHNFIAYKAA